MERYKAHKCKQTSGYLAPGASFVLAACPVYHFNLMNMFGCKPFLPSKENRTHALVLSSDCANNSTS